MTENLPFKRGTDLNRSRRIISVKMMADEPDCYLSQCSDQVKYFPMRANFYFPTHHCVQTLYKKCIKCQRLVKCGTYFGSLFEVILANKKCKFLYKYIYHQSIFMVVEFCGRTVITWL